MCVHRDNYTYIFISVCVCSVFSKDFKCSTQTPNPQHNPNPIVPVYTCSTRVEHLLLLILSGFILVSACTCSSFILVYMYIVMKDTNLFLPIQNKCHSLKLTLVQNYDTYYELEVVINTFCEYFPLFN